jgi:imidazolonepropionase-like amidohydrolase
MRLDPIFDSFYVLGSLWTGLTGPQVCSSIPLDWPRAAYAVAGAPRPAAAAGVTAFVEVNVVPMDAERVLANHTVLVEGNRITALGPSGEVKVPAGAVRIDGRGKYLLPGLADMHSHGTPNTETELREKQDELSARLASGVTMIRHVSGTNHHLDPREDGFSLGGHLTRAPLTIEQLRRQFQAAKLPSPRMHIAPPLWLADGLVPRDSLVAYLAAAKAAGYRHIGVTVDRDTSKRHPQTAAYFNTLVTAARQLGLPVATHTHRPSPEETLALASTGGSVEHILMFYEERDKPQLPDMPLAKMQATAAALRRTGIWVTPTLECHLRLNKPAVHQAMRQIVKTLQDEGVGMLLGLDSPGREVHDELRALVRAGLTPYQALVTGTRNPAAFYKMLDTAGTVAVGKRADLVLLYGNPLQDIRHTREPAGVMFEGHWLDRAALDRAVFTSPKAWLEVLLGLNRLDVSYDDKAHKATLRALADSLEVVAPSDKALSEGLRQRLTAGLGVMRAALKPEQHEFFDPLARIWLREQARQGYPVAIPGAPTPS